MCVGVYAYITHIHVHVRIHTPAYIHLHMAYIPPPTPPPHPPRSSELCWQGRRTVLLSALLAALYRTGTFDQSKCLMRPKAREKMLVQVLCRWCHSGTMLVIPSELTPWFPGARDCRAVYNEFTSVSLRGISGVPVCWEHGVYPNLELPLGNLASWAASVFTYF